MSGRHTLTVEPSKVMRRFYERLQEAVSRVLSDFEPIDPATVKRVMAVDSSYRGEEHMATAALVWDVEKQEVIEELCLVSRPAHPYVSGLLYAREGPAIVMAAEMVGSHWDLLLVDGHGILHPRRAGLAVVVGFLLDRPVLGVAKRLLVGRESGEGESGPVYLDGQVLGYWFRGNGKFYVSPGYKVRVEDTVEVIRQLGGGYPTPLKIAHKLSRKTIDELGGS